VSKTRNFSLQTRARSDSSQRTPVSHNTTTEQREKERGKERETKREKKENTALSFLSSAHPTSHTSTCSRSRWV